jgi:hypothetical protein
MRTVSIGTPAWTASRCEGRKRMREEEEEEEEEEEVQKYG